MAPCRRPSPWAVRGVVVHRGILRHTFEMVVGPRNRLGFLGAALLFGLASGAFPTLSACSGAKANDLLDGDRLVVDTVAAEPALTRCLDYVTAMRQSPAEVGGDTGHRSPLS